jgi:hypothetical protein
MSHIILIFLVSLLLVNCISVFLLVKLYPKIIHIDLTSYDLLNHAIVNRTESEALFAQFQALLALERKLGLMDALPAMRGWAGSPDFLLQIANKVLSDKPNTVLECSSGISTIVSARCLQLNGSGHVYSLEHELEFAQKTRELLLNYGLNDWATVLDAPLQTKYTETPWYDEDKIPKDLSSEDLLIVDGPPTVEDPLARYPALPRLKAKMSEQFSIYIDDADRDGEREMVKRWLKECPELTYRKESCEKGLVILDVK